MTICLDIWLKKITSIISQQENELVNQCSFYLDFPNGFKKYDMLMKECVSYFGPEYNVCKAKKNQHCIFFFHIQKAYTTQKRNLLDSYINYAATASVLLKGPKTTIMLKIITFWQLCQLELENTKHSLPCRINVVLQGKTLTKHDCAAPSPRHLSPSPPQEAQRRNI